MSSIVSLSEWLELLNTLQDRHVLVIGDTILDAYVQGEVTRISAEAPVPIVAVSSEEHRLGGAANVAANVSSLGASCHLIGVVGEDLSATELQKLMTRSNIHTDGLVYDSTRPTSSKTRVIGRNQQIVRVDRESTAPISRAVREEVRATFARLLDETDAVIIEDYDKGLFDKALIAEIRDLAKARDLPVIVDPKIENFWHYHGTTCVTPNTVEAGGGAGRRIASMDDLRFVGAELMTKLALEYLLITRGPDGMSLFERGENALNVTHIPTIAREVFDVTGAGDTVIAVFTTALAAGANPQTAARLANYAGGLVVAHLGCVTASADELRQVLRERAESDVSLLQFESLPAN